MTSITAVVSSWEAAVLPAKDQKMKWEHTKSCSWILLGSFGAKLEI